MNRTITSKVAELGVICLSRLVYPERSSIEPINKHPLEAPLENVGTGVDDWRAFRVVRVAPDELGEPSACDISIRPQLPPYEEERPTLERPHELYPNIRKASDRHRPV